MWEDSGNCRVYYRSAITGGVFCIQDDGAWGRTKLVFYQCSKDGEPEVPLDMPLPHHFNKLMRRGR